MEINLIKANVNILRQYVELRNRFHKELDTIQVTLDETITWIQAARVLGTCIMENNTLIGVGIIYLDRGNEVACFTNPQGKGIVGIVHKSLEKMATKENIHSLWAKTWAEDLRARRSLEKNGYVLTSLDEERAYYKKSIS